MSSAPTPAGRRTGGSPRFRRSIAAAAFVLLAGLTLLPGCRDAPDDSAAPAPAVLRDDVLPAGLPAASPLFTAVLAPAPAARVDRAPLPPEPPDAERVAEQAAQPAPAAVQAKTTAPAETDAGLLVCDPVPASPTLSDFGTGCGHWLHLMAAGQAALGRTPYWEARARAQREMGRDDLRLAPADLAPLPDMIGITHAACGTITGVPGRCTLTYQVYALPGRAPVGAAVSQTGTEAQIVAALPAMAREIDARLGLAAAHVPATAALSPDELTMLGAIPHRPGLSDADLLALSRLSARSPMAGLFLMQTRATHDQTVLNGTVRTLMAQQPENPLVLAEIGYVAPGALRPYASQTSLLFRRFPRSALLAHTEVWQQRLWGTRSGEIAAAQRAAADSPRDPDSWLSPAQTLSNIGQDLRQCRVAGDLSPREWAFLNRIYRQWEGDDLEATRLDPKHGHAWYALAEAATFAGDTPRAGDAFWRAQALDPDKSEVYSWGLEMFQPKWGGDPATLDRVAALAAAQPYDDTDSAFSVASELRNVGMVTKDTKYDTMAAQVMAAIIAKDRDAVRKQPGDALAHWDLAGALADGKDLDGLREATLEYRVAAHLLPNAPQIHYWLSDTLYQRHKGREYVAELRRTIALDPFFAKAHFDLGYELKHEGRFAEALSELKLAMRLDPRDAAAHDGLGDLLAMRHQPAPAAAQYREAVRMTPYFPEAWQGLCGNLDDAGRYDDSLRAGREALHIIALSDPSQSGFQAAIHDDMADDYLHKKEWDDSLAETQTALGLTPSDPVAQENLAEAYFGQGRKAQARAQWEHVLTLGDPTTSAVARRMLAAHP